MDDVIYRQDVLNLIPQNISDFEEGSSLAYDVGKLPSAQQWIPCSERLPNYDEEVLVDYHGRIRLASLTKNDEEYPWYFIVSRFNTKLETVKAWMPLPSPYREGEVLD